MHLYQGTSEQFIADAVQARLANQLSDRFFQEFRYRPSPSEIAHLNTLESTECSTGELREMLPAESLGRSGGCR